MPQYRTRLTGQFDKGSVVGVQSDMTFYQVSESQGEITIHGPGVEESYMIGEDIPVELNTQQRALCAVLLWESQNG
jgi:hypothetical protein